MSVRLALALVLIGAPPVAAQQPPGTPAPPPVTTEQPAPTPATSWGNGWVDFGARVTEVDGDDDRFQRYRDLGDGGFIDRVRWGRTSDTWLAAAAADNVGRDDQRYFGAYERFGVVDASVTWDEIPLRISSETRTPYVAENPGVLRLDDDIQRGIETGRLTLSDIVPIASIFETAIRREGAFSQLSFTPRPDVTIRGAVNSYTRQGYQPWGASFAFNLAVEVPAPVDTRTTDARFEVEWADEGKLARLSYDGSWFNNDVERLIWDNPVSLVDSTSPTAYITGTGTSTGRMALWPSNQMHMVGATGSLPFGGRSRVTANLAIGAATQNAEIVPQTINTALEPFVLPRDRADATVRIGVANVRVSSRPWQNWSFLARYRLHDRSNLTPEFPIDAVARFDQTRQPIDHGPEYYSSTRQNTDLEASYSPWRAAALRAGYSYTHTDLSNRLFDATSENAVRGAIDVTAHQYVTAHAKVERAVRDGSGFRLEELEEVGEQPGLRQFDVADRDRVRFTGMTTVTPVPFLGLSASVAVGEDEYDESRFGLLSADHRIYTGGVDLNADVALFSVSYAHERYDTFQLSRQANPGPQFEDPTRDWGIDAGERVNSVLSSVELPFLIPRTTLLATYDYSRSEQNYLYELGTPAAERTLPEGAPITTLPPVQQLPPVTSELHTARIDSRYFLNDRFAVGVVYIFERFRVDDFALGTEAVRQIDLPGGLLLYYRYRPYTAHSAWARLTVMF